MNENHETNKTHNHPTQKSTHDYSYKIIKNKRTHKTINNTRNDSERPPKHYARLQNKQKNKINSNLPIHNRKINPVTAQYIPILINRFQNAKRGAVTHISQIRIAKLCFASRIRLPYKHVMHNI